MRTRFTDIKNCELYAVDGVIGKVTDLLLEDDSWTIRYLVVDLKHAFSQRRVLISPAAIESVDSDRGAITTSLNSRQVIDGPPLDLELPISRLYEKELVDYYSWPIYWLGRAIQISPQSMREMASAEAATSIDDAVQSNLRSAAEICGYQIHSKYGQAGVLKDLVIRLSSWTIEYATTEPNSRNATESSMFRTTRTKLVDWSNRQIFVDLTQAALDPAQFPPITGEPYSSQPFRNV